MKFLKATWDGVLFLIGWIVAFPLAIAGMIFMAFVMSGEPLPWEAHEGETEEREQRDSREDPYYPGMPSERERADEEAAAYEEWLEDKYNHDFSESSDAEWWGCGDFGTQRGAQAFFEAEGGPGEDPHGLDADGDGLACELNP